MRTWTLIAIPFLLLLAGCGSVTPEERTSTPSTSASVVESRTAVYEDQVQHSIRLSSGEPTGTEVYVALEELRQSHPGLERYVVSYSVAGSPALYNAIWVPDAQRFEWWVGEWSGSVGTAIARGFAPAVDEALLHAVSAGERSVPPLEALTPVRYSDEELAALDATGVARAYFASGDQEVEYWLSARFVQADPETDPWKTSDLERMWGIEDLTIIAARPVRLEGEAARWQDKTEFDVSYSSRTFSKTGEPPGLRLYSIVVGRQSDHGEWKVLRVSRVITKSLP